MGSGDVQSLQGGPGAGYPVLGVAELGGEMGEAEDRWRDEEEERQLDREEALDWEITGEVLTHSPTS